MELTGVTGSPYNTPQVRRKLPEPFTRPRVDLDGGVRVKRSWKDTSVMDVRAGDTVAGFGLVTGIVSFLSVDYTYVSRDDGSGEDVLVELPMTRFRMTNVAGADRVYPAEQRVYAFSVDPA